MATKCRLVFVLFVCACSTAPVIEGPTADVRHRIAAEKFELEGRLAIKQAQEGFSANFSWSQVGSEYAIQLWGPLGQGRSFIHGNADYIEITTPDGQVHGDTRPERLMQEWLGWSVPFNVFRYWIQGYKSPELNSAHVEVVSNLMRQAQFEQLGWTITPSRFKSVDGRILPMKTLALKGEFKITVLIRKASLGTRGVSLDSRPNRHQNSRLSRSGGLDVAEF